jgi:hypothetical protein
MKTFRDLKVFQSAIELMVEVYRTTESYPKREWYGLAAQMRRGSLFELEAQIIASIRLGHLSDTSVLDHHRENTSKLLTGLIRYVRNRELATGNRQRATTAAIPSPTPPSP